METCANSRRTRREMRVKWEQLLCQQPESVWEKKNEKWRKGDGEWKKTERREKNNTILIMNIIHTTAVQLQYKHTTDANDISPIGSNNDECMIEKERRNAKGNRIDTRSSSTNINERKNVRVHERREWVTTSTTAMTTKEEAIPCV